MLICSFTPYLLLDAEVKRLFYTILIHELNNFVKFHCLYITFPNNSDIVITFTRFRFILIIVCCCTNMVRQPELMNIQLDSNFTL